MFARVTVVEGLADQWNTAKDLLTTQAVPRTRGLRGCCASYWLGDPKTGKVLAVAMYPTEKQLHESADTVAAWKEELIPQAGGGLSRWMSMRSSPKSLTQADPDPNAHHNRSAASSPTA